MATYTFGQIESIWLKAAAGTKYATDAWARLMAAIAMAESSGNADATNPTDNNGTQTSWGMWQISLGNHNAPAPNWNDPFENARLAIGKLNDQGLTAWGTYDSGAYKKYMNGPGPTGLPSGSPSGSPSGTPSGTPAKTTGFNPLQWVEAPLKGLEWAGKFAIGTVGGEVPGLASLGDIASGIAEITKTVSKLGQLFLLLFRPAFWLRVGAFLAGVFFLIGAGYFLKQSMSGGTA